MANYTAASGSTVIAGGAGADAKEQAKKLKEQRRAARIKKYAIAPNAWKRMGIGLGSSVAGGVGGYYLGHWLGGDTGGNIGMMIGAPLAYQAGSVITNRMDAIKGVGGKVKKWWTDTDKKSGKHTRWRELGKTWKGITGMNFTRGAGSVALGAGAGAVIGGSIGGGTGATIGSLAGAALPFLAPGLFTNPVGWGLLAAGAVAAVVFAINKGRAACEAFAKAAEEISLNFRNLNVLQLDFSKQNALIDAQFRSFGNKLKDERTSLQLSIAAFKEYWRLHNDPNGEQTEQDMTNGTPISENTKAAIDNLIVWGFGPAAEQQWNKILDAHPQWTKGTDDSIIRGFEYNKITNKSGSSLIIDGDRAGFKQQSKGTLAAMEIVENDVSFQDLTESILIKLLAGASSTDLTDFINEQKGVWVPEVNEAFADFDAEKIKELNIKDLLSTPGGHFVAEDKFADIVDTYNTYIQTLSQLEAGQNLSVGVVGNSLKPFGGIFAGIPGFTTGTASFRNELIRLLTTDEGLRHMNFLSDGKIDKSMATGYVQKMYAQLMQLATSGPEQMRRYAMEYMMSMGLEQLLPYGYKLPENFIYSGQQLGDRMVDKTTGQVYYWRDYIDPQNHLVKSSWIDSKGVPYLPTPNAQLQYYTPLGQEYTLEQLQAPRYVGVGAMPDIRNPFVEYMEEHGMPIVPFTNPLASIFDWTNYTGKSVNQQFNSWLLSQNGFRPSTAQQQVPNHVTVTHEYKPNALLQMGNMVFYVNGEEDISHNVQGVVTNALNNAVKSQEG